MCALPTVLTVTGVMEECNAGRRAAQIQEGQRFRTPRSKCKTPVTRPISFHTLNTAKKCSSRHRGRTSASLKLPPRHVLLREIISPLSHH